MSRGLKAPPPLLPGPLRVEELPSMWWMGSEETFILFSIVGEPRTNGNAASFIHF